MAKKSATEATEGHGKGFQIMAKGFDNAVIKQKIDKYIEVLKTEGVKIRRIYLYGSYAKGTFNEHSDIDLAIFLDTNEIDGFEEDAMLMKLRRKVDLRIEPHAFAKADLEQPNPLVNEIIMTGQRII